MSKKLEKFLFPFFVSFVFIISPLFFSFKDSFFVSDDLSNVITKNNTFNNKLNLAQNDKIIQLAFFKKNFEESNEFDILLPVPYRPETISIFSQAVSSFMNYSFSSSTVQPQLPSSLPYSVGTTLLRQTYPAFVPPDNSALGFSLKENDSNSSIKFFFNTFDRYKNVKIPPNLVTNGHLAVVNQWTTLPRIITREDLSVKLLSKNVQSMFVLHYSDYFKIDFYKQFQRDPNDPKKITDKKVRRTLEKYWKKEKKVRENAYLRMKKDLFENDSVIKLSGGHYKYSKDLVTIYYNLDTDLFAIVDETTNTFIYGGIASLCDYIDIYYFKWFGIEKTFNQSISIDLDNQLDSTIMSYQELRDIGLPNGYSPANWWSNSEEELVTKFLKLINKTPEWYQNLKIGDNQEVNDTSQFEAFTILQLEAEDYINGSCRPDKVNNEVEAKLNTDVRFKSFNTKLICNCKPTIIDIKGLIDPAALKAGNTPFRSLEQQIDDITKSVKKQQIRATNQFDERVLHVINLFRVRPVDRELVIASFKAKAIKKEIDLNCVIFLNTNSNSIY